MPAGKMIVSFQGCDFLIDGPANVHIQATLCEVLQLIDTVKNFLNSTGI